MVRTHARTAPKGQTYIYIPSFLRADFEITMDSKIDITKENGKIVITVGDEK
jgi:hypothetical protein